MMVGLEYLKMSDVAQIPTMPKPFERAVYAPLANDELDKFHRARLPLA
ncbi:MAG: hypothetical protein ABI321_13465 [Polyangia bacterium]